MRQIFLFILIVPAIGYAENSSSSQEIGFGISMNEVYVYRDYFNEDKFDLSYVNIYYRYKSTRNSAWLFELFHNEVRFKNTFDSSFDRDSLINQFGVNVSFMKQVRWLPFAPWLDFGFGYSNIDYEYYSIFNRKEHQNENEFQIIGGLVFERQFSQFTGGLNINFTYSPVPLGLVNSHGIKLYILVNK